MDRLNEIYMGIIGESAMKDNIRGVASILVSKPFLSRNGVPLQNGGKYVIETDCGECECFVQYFTDGDGNPFIVMCRMDMCGAFVMDCMTEEMVAMENAEQVGGKFESQGLERYYTRFRPGIVRRDLEFAESGVRPHAHCRSHCTKGYCSRQYADNFIDGTLQCWFQGWKGVYVGYAGDRVMFVSVVMDGPYDGQHRVGDFIAFIEGLKLWDVSGMCRKCADPIAIRCSEGHRSCCMFVFD